MRFTLASLLVPEPSQKPGEGWTSPTPELEGAMPMSLTLVDNVQARLICPLGLAREVLDLQAQALIDLSERQWETYPATPADDRLNPLLPRPKIMVRDGTRFLGTAPLVSGHRFAFGWSEGAGKVVQVEMVAWQIALGNLREKGNFGTTLRFAFCKAGVGSNSFEPPPVHPYVVQRDLQRVVIESLARRHRWLEVIIRGRRRKRVK